MESTFLTHRRRWQHGDMLFAPISEARTSFVGSFCEVKGYAEDRSLRTYRSIYTYRRTHAHTQTRPTHAPTTRTHTHTHAHTRAEKSHMPIFAVSAAPVITYQLQQNEEEMLHQANHGCVPRTLRKCLEMKRFAIGTTAFYHNTTHSQDHTSIIHINTK